MSSAKNASLSTNKNNNNGNNNDSGASTTPTNNNIAASLSAKLASLRNNKNGNNNRFHDDDEDDDETTTGGFTDLGAVTDSGVSTASMSSYHYNIKTQLPQPNQASTAITNQNGKQMRGIFKSLWYAKHQRQICSTLVLVFSWEKLLRFTMNLDDGGPLGYPGGTPPVAASPVSSKDNNNDNSNETASPENENNIIPTTTTSALPPVDPYADAAKQRHLIETMVLVNVEKVRETLKLGSNSRIVLAILTPSTENNNNNQNNKADPMNSISSPNNNNNSSNATSQQTLGITNAWDASKYHSHSLRPQLTFDELCNTLRSRCKVEQCVAIPTSAVTNFGVEGNLLVSSTLPSKRDDPYLVKLHSVALDTCMKYHRDELYRVKKLKDERSGASELDLRMIAVRRRIKIGWHCEVTRDVKTALHNYDRARYELQFCPMSIETIYLDAVLLLRRLRFSDTDVVPRQVENIFHLMNVAENFDVKSAYPENPASQIVCRLLLFHLASEVYLLLARQICLLLPILPGLDSTQIFLAASLTTSNSSSASPTTTTRSRGTIVVCHPARALFSCACILRRTRELTKFAEIAIRNFSDGSVDVNKPQPVAIPEYFGQFDKNTTTNILARLTTCKSTSVLDLSERLTKVLEDLNRVCNVAPRMRVLAHCLTAENFSLSRNSLEAKNQLAKALQIEPSPSYQPMVRWVHGGLAKACGNLEKEKTKDNSSDSDDDDDPLKKRLLSVNINNNNSMVNRFKTCHPRDNKFSTSTSAFHKMQLAISLLNQKKYQHAVMRDCLSSKKGKTNNDNNNSLMITSNSTHSLRALAAALHPKILVRVRFPSAFYEPDQKGFSARVELSSEIGAFLPKNFTVEKIILKLKVRKILQNESEESEKEQKDVVEELDEFGNATPLSGNKNASFSGASSSTTLSNTNNNPLLDKPVIAMDLDSCKCQVTLHNLSFSISKNIINKNSSSLDLSWHQLIEIPVDDFIQNLIATPNTLSIHCENVDAVVNFNHSSSSSSSSLIILRNLPVSGGASASDSINKIIRGMQGVQIDSRLLSCGTWFPGFVFLAPAPPLRFSILSDCCALEGEDYPLTLGWRSATTNTTTSQENDDQQKNYLIKKIQWNFSIHSGLFDIAEKEDHQKEKAWQVSPGNARDQGIVILKKNQEFSQDQQQDGIITLPIHCRHAGRYRIPFRVVYEAEMTNKFTKSTATTIERRARGYVFIQVRNPLLTVTTIRRAPGGFSLAPSSTSSQSAMNTISELTSANKNSPAYCIPSEVELARFVEIADQKVATSDTRDGSNNPNNYSEFCSVIHDPLYRFVNNNNNNNKSASKTFSLHDHGVAETIPQHKIQSVSIRQENPRNQSSSSSLMMHGDSNSTSSSSSPKMGAAPQQLVIVSGEPHLLLSTFTNHEQFSIVVHKATPATISTQRKIRVVSSSGGKAFPVTLRPMESVTIPTIVEVLVDQSVLASNNSSSNPLLESYTANVQLGGLVVVISREEQPQQQQKEEETTTTKIPFLCSNTLKSIQNRFSARVLQEWLKKKTNNIVAVAATKEKNEQQQQQQWIEYSTSLPSAARVYEPRVQLSISHPPTAKLLEPFTLKISAKNMRRFAQRVQVHLGVPAGPVGYGNGVTIVPSGRVHFVIELPPSCCNENHAHRNNNINSNNNKTGQDNEKNDGEDEEENDETKIFYLNMIPTECGQSLLPPIDARVVVVGNENSATGNNNSQINLLLSSIAERRSVFVS
jgi:hypothetical protein